MYDKIFKAMIILGALPFIGFILTCIFNKVGNTWGNAAFLSVKALKKYKRKMLVGAILVVTGFVLLRTPRGEDSFFSKDVDGISVGDGDVISQNEEDMDQNNLEEYADSSILDTSNTDNSVYIVVKEKEISFGNTEFENIDSFVNYFKAFDSIGINVYLVDDFATSKTYHDVKDSLDSLGIIYEEITK